MRVESSGISHKNTSYDTLNIPTSIFLNRNIGILEAIVEFLKEEHKISYAQIARLTNRDQRNIRDLYLNANIKHATRLISTIETPTFPLSIVTNKHLSTFESIVSHLRNEGFANKDIAKLFARSTKTISTVYMRAKKK